MIKSFSLLVEKVNGLGGLRSLDLQLRRLPRYPCFASNWLCATSPEKKILV